MTASLLCLAAAVLASSGADARRRLGRPATPSSAALRRPNRVLCAVVVASAAGLMGGAGVAVAVAVAVATIIFRLRRRQRAVCLDTERRVLLSALDMVIAELHVGAHPADACDTAARETTGPTSDSLRVAAARARLGGSASDGLRGAATKFAYDGIGESLIRVADAWSVSDRHGLALAELLSAARSDLAARLRIRTRTTAGLAGARATATVLAALPALGVALGQLMGASPLTTLLGGGLGAVLLVLGTVLVCAGLLWTDRIADRVGR
ncbi:secretion protein F [Rhodococcus sp. HNM0563]|uniref:type II secretion system F family protein n=1 Tax=unclassified Rhodococcus (in: high G+C Gram-positive bacteria) TaxID=192944 RepID=UPI00146A8FF7|nr:type II secretion system F family protein [Rhodococcus sp. F64268]MCK0093676.1 type II secretion system F family protein [Rhodococcus sp. F64268]NLU65233.1 secretion protein F [Rhodococcus sp. HNM0563]